tara:strand:- start:5426 stop:5551 length:126 start_codon:yes stop_codon:yes gene_type:complete
MGVKSVRSVVGATGNKYRHLPSAALILIKTAPKAGESFYKI